jgi:hypothetical protein
MSLYENINAQKRAGTSRSKSKSTISPKAYKNMQKGFPEKKKMNYGGMATGSMQQNPQESLMDMQDTKTMVAPAMAKGGKVNPGMDALGKKNPAVANKILGRKEYAMGGGVRKVNY